LTSHDVIRNFTLFLKHFSRVIEIFHTLHSALILICMYPAQVKKLEAMI